MPSKLRLIKVLDKQGKFTLGQLQLEFKSESNALAFIKDANSKGLNKTLYIANYARKAATGKFIINKLVLELCPSLLKIKNLNANHIVKELKKHYKFPISLQAKALWLENDSLKSFKMLKQACLDKVPGLHQVTTKDTLLKNGNGRVEMCTLTFDSKTEAENFCESVIPENHLPTKVKRKSKSNNTIILAPKMNHSALHILKTLSEFDYKAATKNELDNSKDLSLSM